MPFGYLTTTTGFTVEAWVWRDTTPTASETIFYQATQAATGYAGVYGEQMWLGMLNAGAFGVSFTKADGVGYGVIDPAPASYFNDSQWHHFAVRLGIDARSVTVFIDGLPSFTSTLPTAVAWNPGVVSIAGLAAPHRGAYGQHFWNGRMAYVAAYNKPLTDSRVWEHYASGNGGAVYYGDTEVQRLNRVWDWADVPQQSRQLDAAVTTVQGIQVTGANALDESHKAADAGLGLIFADGQSRMVYQSRRHRYNRFVAAVLKESTQSAPEIDFEFSVDDTWVFNDIRGSRPYGATIRIQNADSREEYGRKTLSFELPLTSAEELRNAVNWFANRYADNRPRISGVTLNAVGSDIIEQVATGAVQVGDVITLDELTGKAPESTMTWTVESIELVEADFKNGVWKIRFELSPYELNMVTQVGVSKLGDGSYIAF